ncbi:GNAT family N-acetyltransferase [Corallococcus exercitus]|uniref:GNAT family N-acetyltransferase n=1 Tax=Corallococcus exercitus TaxID=2316736 RepID=A0A7Y4JRG8_9BACT|nr:GNAT family N-acetyltransferase [Corallococcus exercitus]NOK09830.1 GNAT family N-acetyltransferase [Corallococcus exercitus]
MAPPDLKTVELTPELWPDLEKLFGPNGACGGCWCMYWRIPEGERYDDVRGPDAKRRFKALVASGEAKGVLAYADGEPVGWATFGPRRDFPRLDRAPSFKCDDADAVSSVPCFFIHRNWRNQGVATALLAAVEAAVRRDGPRTLEGYPVKPPRGEARISNGMAYTGTLPFFLKRGYVHVADRPAGKQRVRKALTPARRK